MGNYKKTKIHTKRDKMEKVVFLDFDGVINSEEHFKNFSDEESSH